MGSVDLLRHLEKEIPFKVSVVSGDLFSGDLLRHLEKEIVFKASVGSMDLLVYILRRKFPSRCPWTLWIY